MWLRDASLEGKLPTIEQMTLDPYKYFPYRFGHALWSYIGERWGDEAVGAILKATLAGRIERRFRRTIGLTLDQLSDQWRDAVQKQYLPEIGARAKARAVADALLTEKRSEGTLAPGPGALARRVPGGLLQREGLLLVDLYLADGNTGKVKRRILKSGISSNYETYRFINSQAELVARRQVPRVCRQARRAGRHRRSWTSSATSDGQAHQAQAQRRHHAVLEPGRTAAGLHRLRRRLQRPVRGEPGRQRPPAAHRGQVRRPAPGLVARRQDHRLRHRPGPGDRLPDPGHRQLPDRPVRPGDGGTSRCSTRWTRART